MGKGFDWLCDYAGVKEQLDFLLKDKSELLLMVGCGNAPFSPDIYKAGYTNMINIDLSEVVIEQMKRKHPDMRWEVMDVLDLNYEDNSIPRILDKSLIDTLMCYTNSAVKTLEMFKELYRVLQPGGRYIAFSLHSFDEVVAYYDKTKELNWRVHFYRVKSNRWNEDENRNRAVVYTMIVCDKLPLSEATSDDIENVPGTLSEEQFIELERKAKEAILRYDIQHADMDTLVSCLDGALKKALASNVFQKAGRNAKDADSVDGNCEEKVGGQDKPAV